MNFSKNKIKEFQKQKYFNQININLFCVVGFKCPAL